jgi:hypothetical protein
MSSIGTAASKHRAQCKLVACAALQPLAAWNMPVSSLCNQLSATDYQGLMRLPPVIYLCAAVRTHALRDLGCFRH